MTTVELSRRVRIHALHMTSRGGSSHVGAAFSIADILAVLYGEVMRHKPAEPRWPERDRFILSKGHAGAAVYATLAEVGYFSTDDLKRHYQDGSIFSGHVSHKGVPGVELSTGSLGHGLGVGVGMAKALKLASRDPRVFVLLSDGECDEGTIWEAALFAQHHALDNLVAIVDYNKIQSLAPIAETLALEPFRQKWESFNWEVVEVDGHDHQALAATLKKLPAKAGRPTVVIAHTVKGKGVSFMENTVLWHYRTARGDEFDRALAELNS
ncbi:MAG: transketolase [Opitutus sp.]